MATMVGIGALLFAAIGVVVQLKDALNVVWEVEESEESGIWHFTRNYVVSFAAVLALGFLLLVSLLVTAALAAVGKFAAPYLPEAVLHLMSTLVSLAVVTVLFAMTFKWMPDVFVGWSDVWLSVTTTFPNRQLHVILDNLNIHKKNEDWLKAHPNVNFISRRQARPGSTRSRYGSRSCRGSRSAAPPSQASSSFRNTSMPTSTPTTTKPSPSSGPRKRSVNAVSKAAVSLSSNSGY